MDKKEYIEIYKLINDTCNLLNISHTEILTLDVLEFLILCKENGIKICSVCPECNNILSNCECVPF